MNSRLPAFNLSVRVRGEDGRQDGIKIDIGDWFVEGNGNQIGSFVDLLGPPIAPDAGPQAWANILTSLPVASLDREFFGWMMNRPAGNLDAHTEMGLSSGGSGSGSRPGSPLAKGKLEIKRAELVSTPPDGEHHHQETQGRRLILKLFANPTRFVRHQPVPSYVPSRPVLDWELGPANFRTRPIPRRRRASDESVYGTTEFALDNNDNVLIGPRLLSFARPGAWPIHLRRYFDIIESEIESEFARAASELGVHVFRSPRYIPRSIETYFEFQSDNAVRTVRQLRSIIESMANRAATRLFPLKRFECYNEGDSPRIKLTFKSGKEIRVYAKTNHRIRFEAIHKTAIQSVQKFLSSAEDSHRYTTTDRDELLGWIQMLAHDAADMVNLLLSELERRSTFSHETPASVTDLIGDIYETVGNKKRARAMIEILVENGCLRISRRGSDFMPEIRQLRRKGILEKLADTDHVTPRYYGALNALRGGEGLPLLG